MRLFLVRHGQAVSADIDPKRPLTAKGREQVSKSAQFMKRVGANPEEIRHSGKRRAEESAEIIAAVLGASAPLVADERLKPNARVTPVATEVEAVEGDVVLVGHLPFMAILSTNLLTRKDDIAFVNFSEGGVAVLEREMESWWLVHLVQPDAM